MSDLIEPGQRVPEEKLYSKYSLTHAHYNMLITICCLQNKQCVLFHAFFFFMHTEDIWQQKLLNISLLTLQSTFWWVAHVFILLHSTSLIHSIHSMEWKTSQEWPPYTHEVFTSHFPAPGKEQCFSKLQFQLDGIFLLKHIPRILFCSGGGEVKIQVVIKLTQGLLRNLFLSKD